MCRLPRIRVARTCRSARAAFFKTLVLTFRGIAGNLGDDLQRMAPWFFTKRGYLRNESFFTACAPCLVYYMELGTILLIMYHIAV